MVFILILFGLAAIVLQMILPRIPFFEIRPFLVVLPVVYAAMRSDGVRPYSVALVLGSVIDILSPQKFGTSCFVLSLVAGLTWTQRPHFPFDRLSSAVLLSLIATFAAIIVDYIFFSWQSGHWNWHFTIWARMVWVAALNGLLAVPFFIIADLLLFHWLRIAPAHVNSRDYAL